jgi:hypothetical protein
MLLSVSMMGVTSAPAGGTPKIFVDPDMISGLSVGDEFIVDIKISGAVNVYAWGLTLTFAPYLVTIGPISVDEGLFLHGGPYPYPYETYFSKSVDNFGGKVKIGCTRQGDVTGQSGDGTLVSVTFKVLGPGECDLGLIGTELWVRDPYGLSSVNHNTYDGYYSGPTCNLVQKRVEARDMMTGQTQNFYSKVKNEADVPMYVKVKFSMVRDDKKIIDLWAGQRYLGGYLGEPRYKNLWVNGYTPILGWQWMFGSPPYLDAVGDGNYVAENTYCHLLYALDFDDLKLGPDDLVSRAVAQHYARADIDFTQPVQDPTEIDADLVLRHSASGWYYAGALEAGPWWAWRTVTNVGNFASMMDTEEKINSTYGYIHYWTPTYDNQGNFTLDALRIRVEFALSDPASAPVFEIQPNEVLDLDPVTWGLTSPDVGKYYCTTTAFYSLDGINWVRAPKEQTFSWWVTEP